MFPAAYDFDSGLDLSGSYEVGLAGPGRLRLNAGWMGIDGENGGKIRTFRWGGELAHAWRAGRVEPHVGAGFAFHHVSRVVNGSRFGDREMLLGLTVLGGLGYGLGAGAQITVEGRYYRVQDSEIQLSSRPRPRAPVNPSAFSLAFGMKKRF